MSNEQQRTFGEPVGLEPLVPVASHPDDIVVCSDGTLGARRDALTDCKGEFHSNDEDRREANITIVAEILDGVAKYQEEYCTENEDFPSGAAHCVDEARNSWSSNVEEWILDARGQCTNELVSAVCKELSSMDCELEYSYGYGVYSGDGCCLWSYDIGEQEEQVDISCFDELQALHDAGELDDYLDKYNGDSYVNRSRRQVRDEETGFYKSVGRETYDLYGSDYPCIMTYHNIGGFWHFYVPDERMDEALTDAIIGLCRKKDQR